MTSLAVAVSRPDRYAVAVAPKEGDAIEEPDLDAARAEAQRSVDADPGLTSLLRAMRAGDDAVAESALRRVYATLHGLARRKVAGQRDGYTMQATELVHEAYVRLRGGSGEVRDRRHFVRLAAAAMQSIVIDHERARRRRRRAGDGRIALDDVADSLAARSGDLLDLDAALVRLAALDRNGAELIRLRFFAGLSVAEVAGIVDRPLRSVERELHVLRTWLRKELRGIAWTRTDGSG